MPEGNENHKNNEMKMRNNSSNNNGNDDSIDFSVTIFHSKIFVLDVQIDNVLKWAREGELK